MGGENKTLDVELLFCHILNYVEVRLKESYSIGDIAVFDFTTTKLSDFTKLTPMLIKKFHTIVEVFNNKNEYYYCQYLQISNFSESFLSSL